MLKIIIILLENMGLELELEIHLKPGEPTPYFLSKNFVSNYSFTSLLKFPIYLVISTLNKY